MNDPRADVLRRYHPASIAAEMLEFYASVIEHWRADARRSTAGSAST
jgi:hypothetical protein